MDKNAIKQHEFVFSSLLSIGKELDKNAIKQHFNDCFKGDCLLVAGYSEMIKIHYRTNEL